MSHNACARVCVGVCCSMYVCSSTRATELVLYIPASVLYVSLCV